MVTLVYLVDHQAPSQIRLHSLDIYTESGRLRVLRQEPLLPKSVMRTLGIENIRHLTFEGTFKAAPHQKL